VDIETDDDDDEGEQDADLEILDQPEMEAIQTQTREAIQTQARVGNVEAIQTNDAGPSTNKPKKWKRSPKIKPKSSGEALVGVMDRFVNIKEKEANNDAAQQFTITKCIAALRTLEGFDPTKKSRAFVVFKSVHNHEIFLNAVKDKDGSALTSLRSEMAKLA
jgi:hypothetical protein